MSGAAVFPYGEELLLGVVRDDLRPSHGTRLAFTRSEDLLASAEFRAVVREATSVDPTPEPAELTGLLEPTPPKREVTSPTMLLRADAEVVSFHGREDTLTELVQWCVTDRDGLPSVRVLTGPGGQGKTRLARQLTARMRERGWVAYQVVREPLDLRVLRTVQRPQLLVVDYAETRPELVRSCASRPSGPGTRCACCCSPVRSAPGRSGRPAPCARSGCTRSVPPPPTGHTRSGRRPATSPDAWRR